MIILVDFIDFIEKQNQVGTAHEWQQLIYQKKIQRH